jgi:hypothetical protein
VAIQAYVDDSGGKGQGPLFVFSALMTEAEQWARFSDKWSDCLKESPSIRYFKMDEAAGPNGEFYGFKENERNHKLEKLCHIISEFSLRELHCILDLSGFQEIVAATSAKPMSQPYFFPFHTVIVGVGCDLLDRGQSEPFEIFFDENAIFGPRAKAWYPIIRSGVDENVRTLMPVEPIFRSDLHTMPLQAADMTAWIRRRLNSEGLGEFDWLQGELTITPSPRSVNLNYELLKWIDEQTISPGLVEKIQVGLEEYRKVFGHDWPPKNARELKRHRGR